MPTFALRGCWEEKRESKELKNYLKKNERKLSYLSKGNRHTSPGSTESSKQVGPRGPTLRHMIIKMPKVKDKERILEAAREKHCLTTKEIP